MLLPYTTIYIVAALLGCVGIAAHLAKQKVATKRPLWIAGQVIGFGGAVVVLGYCFVIGQKVIVFEGKRPQIEYSKFVLLGTLALDHTKNRETIGSRGGGTWLVNETDADLTITTASYGTSAFSFSGGDSTETVAAGAAGYVDHAIDHFGPDDPLPSSVSSKSSFETRTQVSW